uniref:20 kDa chaperonin, chloroplastic n=1 Tax=Chlamydomonas leiostraca TaxID=1034604 RepID=A0A7S0RR56_9CHLO|mmetsp:Transcript_29305/g.74655  ORF Transcript_29305/g.74655 Transcript_29305/m.74655 type:complete len:237 (+) Transcript_29305:39-749(+)|eukprot:CAMPEP_0202865406 /NCGR_PEP_ID=MMETSP1391-20130828/5935_1 /ASSEMBLY_ACC=CAM_ASM_000867 /TAXON_ID=1034604 /ORGANISM="Chlamydomonas leiostraca, Strain SAG 11-49" /LENGTH=236 /DNA_ID=CAMNT_0049545247 /DNA_START=38 /DNA_END=748 /DNA_ORIENTATION=+
MSAMRALRPAPFTSARVSRSRLNVRAEAVKIPDGFAKISPRGDRVLVKVAEEETKTRGGILLPTSAVKKPTSGDVVELGDGRVNGETRPFILKTGDTVLYSKFGFMYTDIKLKEQDFILIREEDVIGIMPRQNAQADDIPNMKPMSDRVLIKVEETADVTIGGVLLPETAKERPLSGTVVSTGPGKYDAEAEEKRKPMRVQPGDRVLYFKYAGDNMETPDGTKYVVLREDDILCKA